MRKQQKSNQLISVVTHTSCPKVFPGAGHGKAGGKTKECDMAGATMNRRTFLKLGGAVTAGLGSASLLAGCGGGFRHKGQEAPGQQGDHSGSELRQALLTQGKDIIGFLDALFSEIGRLFPLYGRNGAEHPEDFDGRGFSVSRFAQGDGNGPVFFSAALQEEGVVRIDRA